MTKRDAKDEKKAPKLRFKGFTDDWEQRHFFDNIKKTIDFRGRTPKKLGMDWSKSGYLALSALNVKDGYIDYSADAHYANQKLYDKWMSGNNLVKGQVLFTTEAPMGNIAQVPDNKGYVLSQRTIAFVTNKDKITDDFLASILRTPQSFKRLSALSSGGTAKGVSQKSLSSFKLVIPPSLKEQEKIGKLFRSFEHTIYLHEEKRKQLEQLKKALLQKMFADKTNFPEIRFNGYVGPWEQRKLGQLGIISRGLTYRPNDVTDKNGVRVLRSSNIYEDSFVLNDDDVFVNSSVVNVPNLKNGDILVTSANGSSRLVGKHAIIKGLSNKTVHGGFMLAIRPATNSYFLNSLMSTSWYDNFISTFVSGGNGSIGNLKKSDLERQSIFIPLNKEQNKIGQLFQSLEKTITLHDQKIEDLKQLKQALLQQMFI